MKKIAVLVAVALAASLGTYAIADTGRPPSDPRVDMTRLDKAIKNLEAKVAKLPAPRIKCKTLPCINRTLTNHGAAIKKLKRDVKILNLAMFDCQAVADLTQYGDFAADGGGTTTGLDFTGTGDPVDLPALAWLCGT